MGTAEGTFLLLSNWGESNSIKILSLLRGISAMSSSQLWSPVPGYLANVMNFPRSCCQSPRRSHGAWRWALELNHASCLDLILLSKAWNRGLLEEGDTRTSWYIPLHHCQQHHGAGWDHEVPLLKPWDGKGADASHLSPFAHQKCCEETAQLGAKEHIC